MTFIDAVSHAKSGATIVSNAGNHYTAADLAPIQCGPHWAIIANKSGMARQEREGNWYTIVGGVKFYV